MIFLENTIQTNINFQKSQSHNGSVPIYFLFGYKIKNYRSKSKSNEAVTVDFVFGESNTNKV